MNGIALAFAGNSITLAGMTFALAFAADSIALAAH